MRRYLLLLGVLLIIVAIGVNRNFFSKNPQSTYTGPVEKIRIGNVREYSIFNSIAQENGYFTGNGLEGIIQEYESGPPAVKDLVAGKVDVAFASDNAGVQTIFTHPELRIIAQFVRNRVFSVIVRKDQGITMPSDLRGKKIGVTKKSAGEFLLSQFLTFHNLNQQDIIIVDLPPSQIKAAFQQGAIDAAVMFEPNIFDLIKSMEDNVAAWPIEDGYYTYGLIYTTDAVIKSHPLLLRRYLQSLIESEQYMKSHTSETKALIGHKYGYSKEYIDYSWPKNDHQLALNQELLLSMENIAAWAIENKLTDKTIVPNYLNYIYFDALNDVKPDAITIIR